MYRGLTAIVAVVLLFGTNTAEAQKDKQPSRPVPVQQPRQNTPPAQPRNNPPPPQPKFNPPPQQPKFNPPPQQAKFTPQAASLPKTVTPQTQQLQSAPLPKTVAQTNTTAKGNTPQPPPLPKTVAQTNTTAKVNTPQPPPLPKTVVQTDTKTKGNTPQPPPLPKTVVQTDTKTKGNTPQPPPLPKAVVQTDTKAKGNTPQPPPLPKTVVQSDTKAKGNTQQPPPLPKTVGQTDTKAKGAPKVETTKTTPGKVAPKVDRVNNPPTKLDPKKTDPAQVAVANKAQAESRVKAEANLRAEAAKRRQELAKAKTEAKENLNKNLTPEQKKAAAQSEQVRLKKEQELRDKTKATAPAIPKDTGKLAANTPATGTKDSAKALSLTTSDNSRLINIKKEIKHPTAQRAIDDVLKGRQASASEIASLQAQLNNPNLSTAQKATLASSLQNQADIRRQNNFTNSLNQLNGNLAAGGGFPGGGGFPPTGGVPPVLPPPVGGGGRGFGNAFLGGFVGGLVGGLVGNLVFPGSGVVVPGGYNPGLPLQGGIPFDPGGYSGYIDNGPAVYYPPTDGLANSGSVLVQTLPCGCTANFNPGFAVTDPNLNQATLQPGVIDPGGSPAIVIDPTSQEVKLTTRYLRLINSSPEKITASIVLKTPSGDDGAFVWLPDEPGKGDGAFTVELLPGEEKDIFSSDTQLHGSRARIWGTGESGRTWRQFENVDFWLVPETEEDGTHAYAAPGMETAVYNLR